MVTRNRTVNYREPDSDSDDEVIYVGQRTKAQRQWGVPVPTLPKITLGEEDYLVQPIVKIIKNVKVPSPIEDTPESGSIVESAFKGQRATEVVVKEKEEFPTKLVVQDTDRALFQSLPYEVCHSSVTHLLAKMFRSQASGPN